MSGLTEFFDALLGEYEGPLFLDTEIGAQETDDRKVITDNEGDLYFQASLPDRTATFVYRFLKDVDAEYWQNAMLEPSAVLWHPDRKMLVCWAFEAPFALEELENLAGGLECDLGAFLPAPGTDGWQCVFADPQRFHPLDTLIETYGLVEDDPEQEQDVPDREDSEPETVPEPESSRSGNSPSVASKEQIEPEVVTSDELPMWGDAAILTRGYNPEADAKLAQPITISQGANSESKKWLPKTLPMGAFLAQLCQHKEGPKDGLSFVGGKIEGDRRTQNAVSAIYSVGLDIDVGMPLEDVERAVNGLGCVAVIYTTHSHMNDEIAIAKDKVAKFAGDREVDDELIREYLREVGKYHASIVDSAEFTGFEHRERGLVAVVSTMPIPKCRVVVPLAEPFIVANEGKTQREAIEKWQAIPQALADSLGIPIDKTGKDASRLFYYPRHKKGRPFEAAIFGGKLFDWRELDLAGDPLEAAANAMMGGGKGERKSKTDHGLGEWSRGYSHGFQVMDALQDYDEDNIRSAASAGYNIKCPFDEEHSNPDDPDDQACYAVNAGDSKSDFFIVKCQHDTCREKTHLDMLGKLVKDGRLPMEALTDPRYLPADLVETAPDPVVAQKIVENDEAEAGLPAMIAALSKTSSASDVHEVIAEIAKLTDGVETLMLIEKVKAAVPSVNSATLKKEVAAARREKEDQKSHETKVIIGKDSRATFQYYVDFHFDEAVKEITATMLRANEGKRGKNAMPVYTCTLDTPVRLRSAAGGKLSFVDMDRDGFWSEACKWLSFQRETDNGKGPREQVPRDAATAVYKTCWEHLPQTPEIIYTPIFTAEGALVRQPGWYYDGSRDGLNVLMADIGFDVPTVSDNPTDDEIDAALALLRNEILIDFPFCDMGPDGAERRDASEANALAMIITPFMRRMIDGCTPTFFITKPTPGTGGTYLAKVPMYLFDGHESFPMAYYRDNDEEQRKALLSAVMETRSMLFFDDVKEFSNRVLLQSITARKIGGRILGQSLNAERDNNFLWVGTGNNTHISNEMERRVCWIRLNLKKADIQNRTYRHPSLLNYCLEERGMIVHAILTLIQGWIIAGMPRFKERKMATFEEWSEMVGGVLEFAGVYGFIDNRRPAGAEMDHAATMEFIRFWVDKIGGDVRSAKELLEVAISQELDIIEGNSDDQKKHRFRRRLEQLEGQTFEIEEHTYIVRRLVDTDGAPAFALTRLETAEEQLAAEVAA